MRQKKSADALRKHDKPYRPPALRIGSRTDGAGRRTCHRGLPQFDCAPARRIARCCARVINLPATKSEVTFFNARK